MNRRNPRPFKQIVLNACIQPNQIQQTELGGNGTGLRASPMYRGWCSRHGYRRVGISADALKTAAGEILFFPGGKT